ncbi:MAG: hypothetical protein ACI9U2_000780, partial [Bradymonadia bacterium]
MKGDPPIAQVEFLSNFERVGRSVGVSSQGSHLTLFESWTSSKGSEVIPAKKPLAEKQLPNFSHSSKLEDCFRRR